MRRKPYSPTCSVCGLPIIHDARYPFPSLGVIICETCVDAARMPGAVDITYDDGRGEDDDDQY